MAFYALEISLTDWKLSELPPRLLSVFYAIGVGIFAVIALQLTTKEITLPNASQWIVLICMIICGALATWTNFAALHNNLGATRLTLLYCLIPVVAQLFTFILNRELPSIHLVGAWLLATGSLYLVSIAK